VTYEAALARAIQRTEAGAPTVVQRSNHHWITRPVAISSNWPRGSLTYECAAERAKAATEAGRPQIVVTVRGVYHVRNVPLSSPFRRRYTRPAGKIKLSEAVVAEVREAYKAGWVAMRELARRHDVGYSTIWQAIHGLTWADVT
jgi:hypothetical protein